jgi:hypothetical protein
VDTSATPAGEILAAARQLCPPSAAGRLPRRTTLFTFGIDVDPKEADSTGEKLLQDLAQAGGGRYSAEFGSLAGRLEETFEQGKQDFYLRREPFALRIRHPHPVLQGHAAWPELSFRNRVKAKPYAETILTGAGVAAERAASKRRPDPILILSGANWPGAARTALLALTLDGADGAKFLAAPETRSLLPALLNWAEAKEAQPAGLALKAVSEDGENLSVEVRAQEPLSHLPLNGRHFKILLTPLQPPPPGNWRPAPVTLKPEAPGVYRAKAPVSSQTIYRLALFSGEDFVEERFLGTPYPLELRRFGTDRAAMRELVRRAGGGSMVIESPRDLKHYAETHLASREHYSLRPWLLLLGLALALGEFAMRVAGKKKF